ncbi:hypothetical protein, partial [Treponema sp. R6D11]
IDDSDKDHEELEELREKGATPVTFPPDNASYLEDEDHLNLDLSDAAIDEPDLSTDSIDKPLNEPSLDIESLDDFNLTDTEDKIENVSGGEVPPDEPSLDDIDIDINMPLEEPKADDLSLSDDSLSDVPLTDDSLSADALSDASLDSVLDSGSQSDDGLTLDESLTSDSFDEEVKKAETPLDEDTEDITIDEDLIPSDIPDEEPVAAKAAPAPAP